MGKSKYTLPQFYIVIYLALNKDRVVLITSSNKQITSGGDDYSEGPR